MRNLDKAVEIIKSFEGILDGDPSTANLDPYLCPAGYWTIGWGHVVRDASGNSFRGAATKKQVYSIYPKGITVQEAEVLLWDDVRKFAAFVDSKVKKSVNDNQYAALVSFCFNVGTGNFNRSTLLRRLNAGKYDDVPDQMKLWVKGTVSGTKKVIKGLVNRRAAEVELWSTPV